MASSRIAGITIEIGGDTTKLQSSLKAVDKQLGETQKNLKDIDKLLKLNPGNVELLTQKQKNLTSAIQSTEKRLQELKDAQSGVAEGTDEWDKLQREIISTETDLKSLKGQYKDFGSVAAQQVAAAGQKMEDFGNKVTKAGEAFQPISTAATAALGDLVGLAYKAVTTADDLNTLSKQTGFTTEEIQKMKYAADLVDVSFEDIEVALKKLKPKITENNKAMADLGVSTKNADGSTRDATAVFYDAIEALSKIPNETERDQKAMELFGKSADDLAGIIDDGGKSLKEYGDEAQRLGLIMSTETLNDLNTINDTIDRLKAQFTGSLAKLGATLATTFAPILEKAVGFLERVSDALANITPQQAEVIVKILAVTAALAPLLTIGGKLISGIGTLLTFAPLLATAFGAITPYILPIVVAIGGLIAAGVLLYKNWDTISAKATQLKNTLAGTWNSITTNVSGAFNNVMTKIKNTFESIKNFIRNTIDSIKNLFNFNWSLPRIKLPHFSWKWYSVGGLFSLPDIRVNWYKKAYDNPYLFTSPTVMATPNGYKGFGDGNGGEVVLGMEKLKELVGASGDTNVTINVYASQGMNVNELASKIEARFIGIQRQKEAAGLA